ncbi:predicted protein [Naegleria gruberi]|uniref:Predicted protein n=1 Tax=Naegleria gruberi TaxID=5762 RepID=D2VR88_NAEGR|nr:uncharacterized protein NAEGRDRAFT_71501 [Naegleria gruberi]EFC40564.1 predicted protein [Naegleria gruberi]|eukprot:XP_002673308.1 predicted protein [Naegleria gruberi strain NEG-M]
MSKECAVADREYYEESQPPTVLNNQNNAKKLDESFPPVEYHENSLNSLTPDYIYLDENNIEKDLICSLCYHPFIDPIMHSTCENMFCSSCVKKVIGNKCPLCKGENFTSNCSSVPRFVTNKLLQLKVECSMCKGAVARGDLKDHQEKYCPLHDAYQQVTKLKEKLEEECKEKKDELGRKLEELSESLNLEWSQKKDELTREFESKEEELHERIELFENQILAREKLENVNKPIHLNVGGTILTVSLGTFIHNERESDNLFKKMFTGEYPCYQTPSKQFEEPVYYVDCDPMIFRYILGWLQYGKNSIGPSLSLSDILLACKKFSLDNLAVKLTKSEYFYEISQLEFFKMKNSSPSIILNKFDMTNLMLRGMDLQKSSISLSLFRGMDLSGVNFSNSNLNGCNFSGCILDGTNFSKSNLSNANIQISSSCNFTNCDFSGCLIDKSNLNNLSFSGSSFKETKFVELCNLIENVTLSKCTIYKVYLNGKTFNRVDFSETSFKDCKFADCTFKNCNFSETQWKTSKVERCNFLECIQ